MKTLSDRTLLRVSVIGTGVFVACYAVAIARYPGGTWFNRRAIGHSFSSNFLCDLMQTRALNGEDASVGSSLARVGIVFMLAALAAFYAQVARLETPTRRIGRVAQRAGLLAAVLGLAIPIATSDRFREAHIISVVVAFVPSVLATSCAFWVCWRTKGVATWVRTVAAITLLAGVIDGVMYAFVYASPLLGMVPASRDTRRLISQSLPLFQRIASLGLLAWVIAMAALSYQRSRNEQPCPSPTSG